MGIYISYSSWTNIFYHICLICQQKCIFFRQYDIKKIMILSLHYLIFPQFLCIIYICITMQIIFFMEIYYGRRKRQQSGKIPFDFLPRLDWLFNHQPHKSETGRMDLQNRFVHSVGIGNIRNLSFGSINLQLLI